jgi:hypothetical protein
VAAYVAVAATLASRAPLVASVAGLMVLGILHNVLELRYVLARWRDAFRGPFAAIVLGLVTVIALGRLAGGTNARKVEVVAGFAILGAGLALNARHRPITAAAGLPMLAVATATAWAHLDLYFVTVTYLHNLVPFAILWDWSSRAIRDPRAKAAFRAVNVTWLVAVPAALLSGAIHVPSVNAQAHAVRFAGPVARHVATVAPPGWRGPEAARLLAVFAFLQVLHYAFWCVFLPRHALERQWTPRHKRLAWAAVATTAAAFAMGYATAWTGTKIGYTSLASYHAYVEYAVLAAVVFRRPEVRT